MILECRFRFATVDGRLVTFATCQAQDKSHDKAKNTMACCTRQWLLADGCGSKWKTDVGPQMWMSSLVLTIHNFGVPNFDPYPDLSQKLWLSMFCKVWPTRWLRIVLAPGPTRRRDYNGCCQGKESNTAGMGRALFIIDNPGTTAIRMGSESFFTKPAQFLLQRITRDSQYCFPDLEYFFATWFFWAWSFISLLYY